MIIRAWEWIGGVGREGETGEGQGGGDVGDEGEGGGERTGEGPQMEGTAERSGDGEMGVVGGSGGGILGWLAEGWLVGRRFPGGEMGC